MTTSSYVEDEDKAKNSVLYFPSTDYSPQETFEKVKLDLLENKIELALIPAAVNALFRTSMYIDVHNKFIIEQLYEIFREITSPSRDDAVVEATIQACIAIPEPNRLIDYSFAVGVLSKLLLNEDLNPAVLKTIKQNINDRIIKTDINTDFIVVNLVYRILDENQEINSQTLEIIKSQFIKGTWYACRETSEAILKGLKKDKFTNLSVEQLATLWERAKIAIYDPDEDLVIDNYHIAQNCAKILGCFTMRKHGNIFSFPEIIIPNPLNDLPNETNNYLFNGNPMMQLVSEIVDEIEEHYQDLIDRKYSDPQMRFCVSFDLISKGALRRHYMGPYYSKEQKA